MTFVSLADELAGVDSDEGNIELWHDDDLEILGYGTANQLVDEIPQNAEGAARAPQHLQAGRSASAEGVEAEFLAERNHHATPRRGHIGFSRTTPRNDSPASVALSVTSYRTAPTSPEGHLPDQPAVCYPSPAVGRLRSIAQPHQSPPGHAEAISTPSDGLDAVDDLDEVSRHLPSVLSTPPDTLGTPATLVEPTQDPLVELQEGRGTSTRLTIALHELDREHASRKTELRLERLIRMNEEAEKERDDHIRQIQLLKDGFAEVNWGRGLRLSPLLPSCQVADGLVGDGRTWSDEGSDHQANDVASPTESEDDASLWPPSSWSGTHTEYSRPDIDTCDMDEILSNMELSDLAAEAEDLHHLLVQDQEEALISGLRALDESLSIALSHSTHAARQLRGIKAAIVSAREAEEDKRSARDGVEAWERAKMQRGLRGDTAGTEARLRELCKGWEQSVDAWGSRMRDISATAAEGRRTLVADLERQRTGTVPAM